MSDIWSKDFLSRLQAMEWRFYLQLSKWIDASEGEDLEEEALEEVSNWMLSLF